MDENNSFRTSFGFGKHKKKKAFLLAQKYTEICIFDARVIKIIMHMHFATKMIPKIKFSWIWVRVIILDFWLHDSMYACCALHN